MKKAPHWAGLPDHVVDLILSLSKDEVVTGSCHASWFDRLTMRLL